MSIQIAEFYMALRILEVGASLITGFSLLAIAIHEVSANGWRAKRRKK